MYSFLKAFLVLMFMETDLHLQISQHQAHCKHENFTVSYHSYPKLLPQNMQLHLHLIVHFTASTIWGLQKFGLVGIVSYHCMFLILKCI